MKPRRLRSPSAAVRGILRTNQRKSWLKTRIKMQHGMCAYCKKPLGDDATLDHYIPLSKDGEDAFSNTRAAHRACNHRKGSMMPEEFMGMI